MIPNWENTTLNYDLTRYAWPSWILEIIQELYPELEHLEDFHNTVDPKDISKVTEYVQKSFARREWQRRFDDFASEYIAPLIETPDQYLIKRQPTLNLVIPNQEQHRRRLPFHQGIFYNNGRGQRTIWMALTKCEGTNSMWIADLDPSRDITRQTIQNRWDLEKFESECIKISRPVEIAPGQCHLFHQEHIHGNVNNTTGYTRMSIDWHVLIKNGEYGRRMPGGFFREPGDFQQSEDLDYSHAMVVPYVNNNSEYDKHIPFHYQRLLMDAYCKSIKAKHQGYQFENEYLHWLPILEHYIKQKPDVIVMNSIYSLPDDHDRSRYLIDLAISLGVELHFANELCIIKDTNDLGRIDRYRNFGVPTQGPMSWQI